MVEVYNAYKERQEFLRFADIKNKKIAVGLEENKGRESRIVPLGAAKAIAFYDSQTDELDIIDIAKECKDRLSIIFQGISTLYHPIPKICPTIAERARQEGIELKTGKWQNLEDLINNLDNLKDLK